MPTMRARGAWLGPPLGVGTFCVCIPNAFAEGAQVPNRPFLPSVFVSQCQGPTAFQSTRALCLLASMTIVLEYVSFKLRVNVTAACPSEAMLLCL